MMPRSPGVLHSFLTAFSTVAFISNLTAAPVVIIGLNLKTIAISALFGHGWFRIINQIYEDKNQVH